LKSEVCLVVVILSSFVPILLRKTSDENETHILDVLFNKTGVLALLLPFEGVVSQESNTLTRKLIFVGSTIEKLISAQGFFLQYLLSSDLFISSTPVFSINDDNIFTRITNSLKINTVPQFTQYVQQQPQYGYQQNQLFSPQLSPQYVVLSDNSMNNYQNSSSQPYQNVVFGYPPNVQVQQPPPPPMFVQVLPLGNNSYSPYQSQQYHTPTSQGWIYPPNQNNNHQSSSPVKKESFKDNHKQMKETSNSEIDD
jgi:hypothetical protein